MTKFLSVFLFILPVALAWWRPSAHQTWQWQLDNSIDTSLNVQVYDVDLFDVKSSDIHAIKSHGRKLVCYFSAGSYENWRPDANQFPASTLGNKLEGWDERWLDIRKDSVKQIMEARLTKAVQLGCDGVEPDNVDGYSNKNGLGLTSNDQKQFNIWLAQTAHSKGLSVGLKNAVDLIKDLEPYFDWALNEECVEYDECNKYKPFIDHSKPVFHVEYVDHHSQGSSKKNHVCRSSGRPHQFNTLIKDWDLTSWRLTC
ncbi:hypothetical protein LOTGIDRAFT_163670 [Lottia gigantea]|uniref:Glycoside-hydrolase family GH114 TIM-barrel domain-containing protein n=1 Tax=Lottia gigantea TaxID=225164 RepID=V3ZHN9_LOTGI|nr:hypothetical protein LOTGIDRAFT_163670 [Lottia gigantea]ESO90788.1 hypothetical protein LOTGIDRAFT_163670 [Lottia gigantea]